MNTERKTLLSQFDSDQDRQFKGVIGNIVKETAMDTERFEESIFKKISISNMSRGWKRPSGAKVAPMKILIN